MMQWTGHCLASGRMRSRVTSSSENFEKVALTSTGVYECCKTRPDAKAMPRHVLSAAGMPSTKCRMLAACLRLHATS